MHCYWNPILAADVEVVQQHNIGPNPYLPNITDVYQPSGTRPLGAAQCGGERSNLAALTVWARHRATLVPDIYIYNIY